MVTDGQVRVLRRKLMEGKTQEAAAAGAGMSVRSARKWQAGSYPSQAHKPHLWRTRPDPFAGLFESEIAPLLAADEKRMLEARTLLGELDRRHPGCFSAHQLRTLQRCARRCGGAGAGRSRLGKSSTSLRRSKAIDVCLIRRNGCSADGRKITEIV